MSKSTTENFPKLKSSELIEEMLFTIRMQEATGSSVPMMIWGQPGAGKSDIVKEVGKRSSRPIIDIRLLLKDPTDLSGIPYINSHGEMGFAAPADLPVSDKKAAELKVELAQLKSRLNKDDAQVIENLTEEDVAKLAVMQIQLQELVDRIGMTRAIILLDELSSSPAALQAAALQLVLDRKVGTYTLPKDVVIFAAGNRASDKTVHHEMPMPLRNRMRHAEFLIDSEEWIRWAISAKVHPAIVGMIKAKPTMLNQFADALKHQQYAFATPRTWKQSSDVLYFSESEKASSSLIQGRMASIVGAGTATQFTAHLKYVHKLPSPEAVATGREKSWNKDLDMSAAYTMIINTLYWVHGKLEDEKQKDADAAMVEMTKRLDNTLRYMMDNFESSPELCIMGAYMVFTTYRMPYEGQCLDDLVDKYGDFIQIG
jgi:hypothetical protein